MAVEVVENAEIPAYSYAEVVRSLVAVAEDPDELVGHSLVEMISACEQVIRAAQALQAEASVALLREREQAMTGRQAHLSTVGETSLARGVASSTAARQLETALAITAMPTILAGWRDGLINEATARAITTALPALAPDELALVEAELEPLLPSLTPRKAGEIVRGLVIEIDPDAADAKALAAREDRYVLVHDEADAMAALIAHGPAEQVRALKNALTTAADAQIAAGDPRTRGQIMFDTLHAHTLSGDLTGLLDAPRHGYTVEIGILMTTDQLQGTTDSPAILDGHGPVAPAITDQIVNDADAVFYRRIITDPVDHTLRSVDTQRRLFTGPLARFVRARDKNRCRKPWCTAPGRHTDHIHPHQRGGPTTAGNAQRLCVQDHLIKHLPGWQIRPHPDGSIEWTTPTGHTYTSHTPHLT